MIMYKYIKTWCNVIRVSIKKLVIDIYIIYIGGAADKEKFVKTNKLTSFELLTDAGDVVRNSWKVPRAAFGNYYLLIYIISYVCIIQ